MSSSRITLVKPVQGPASLRRAAKPRFQGQVSPHVIIEYQSQSKNNFKKNYKDVGASQSTVGVWAKFSSPLNDPVINIFVLGRKYILPFFTSTVFFHFRMNRGTANSLMSDYRYHSLYLNMNQALVATQRVQLETDATPTAEFATAVPVTY